MRYVVVCLVVVLLSIWLGSGCSESAPAADPGRAVRVVDGRGQPVAGVAIRHLTHAQWLRGEPPLSSRFPDPWSAALAEGAESLSDVEGRALVARQVGYLVATDGERFATASLGRDGEATLDLVLGERRDIDLRVVLDDGSAAAGVPVALHQGAYVEGQLGPEVWRWRTAADGTVRASFLPAESRRTPLTVAIVVPGLAIARTVAVDVDEVLLRLPPVGAVEVRLVGGPDPGSMRPSLALARPAVGPGFPQSWLDPTPTEDPRRCRFWPVPLGSTLRVSADRRHYEPVVADGPTEPGASVTIELRAREN